MLVLYGENDKRPLKDMVCSQRGSLILRSQFSLINLKFNAIPIKIPLDVFCGIWEADSIFIGRSKKQRIANAILKKKNKVDGTCLPVSKISWRQCREANAPKAQNSVGKQSPRTQKLSMWHM